MDYEDECYPAYVDEGYITDEALEGDMLLISRYMDRLKRRGAHIEQWSAPEILIPKFILKRGK